MSAAAIKQYAGTESFACAKSILLNNLNLRLKEDSGQLHVYMEKPLFKNSTSNDDKKQMLQNFEELMLTGVNSTVTPSTAAVASATNKYLLEGGRRRRAASKKASKAKAPKKASKASKAAKKRTKRSSKK